MDSYQTNKKRFWLLSILAVAGLIVSLIQSDHYFEYIEQGVTGGALCDINSTFSCSAVETSRFGELWKGHPVSSLAGGWYLFILVLLILSIQQAWASVASKALRLSFGIAALASVFYLVIMVAVIKAICIYCLAIDAINFVGLGIVWGWTKPSKSDGETRSPWLKLSVLAIAVVALMVFAQPSYFMNTSTGAETRETVMTILHRPRLPVNVEPGPALLERGTAGAPVVIVKFGDFQCPACRMGGQTVAPVLERYKEKVHFVFKNFPWDSQCNRKIQRAMHAQACSAAYAVQCAQEQGKFYEFYNKTYEAQAELSSAKLLEIADSLGLNRAAFEACLSSPEVKDQVQRQIEEGIALNIEATPTFFVNGRRVEGALPTHVWFELVDEILKNPLP